MSVKRLRQFKKDSVFVVGIIILLFVSINTLQIEERAYYTNFILNLFVFGISIAMNIIMHKHINVDGYDKYKALVTIYAYTSSYWLIVFMLKLIHPSYEVPYTSIRSHINAFQIISYMIVQANAKLKWKESRISNLIGFGFLIIMVLGSYEEQLHPTTIAEKIILNIGVLSICVLSSYWLSINKKKIDPKGYNDLMVFIWVKVIYHLVGIGDSFSLKPDEGPIYGVLQFICAYYLLLGIYYICLRAPWIKLIKDFRDTTELIRYNEQGREALINLSHELKTPINVIQSAADILRLDIKDKSCSKYLLDIKNYCVDSMKIIRNIIDINKLEGGYMKPFYQNYNVVEVVENVIGAYAGTYPGLPIVFNTEEEEFIVSMDLVLIQRCIMYLVAIIMENRKDESEIYIDLTYDKHLDKVSICFINAHLEELIKEMDERFKEFDEVKMGDNLAMSFMKRVLLLHQTSLKCKENELILDFEVKSGEMEAIILDESENIDYLKEQIKTSYMSYA